MHGILFTLAVCLHKFEMWFASLGDRNCHMSNVWGLEKLENLHTDVFFGFFSTFVLYCFLRIP